MTTLPFLRDFVHVARRALALLLCLPVLAAAAAVPLEGRWLAADGEAAAAVHADDPRMQRFEPARFTQFPSRTDEAWVMLRPRDGRWPKSPLVLGLTDTGLQTVTLHVPGRTDAPSARIGRRDAGTWPGHGRLAFPLDAPPADGEWLRLHVDSRGAIRSAIGFSIQPMPEFVADDARWVAIASASLAVMLAMTFMALCFALRLRDLSFVHYSLFIASYAFVLAAQSNYLFDVLGWTALAPSLRLWVRLAITLAVAAAALFLVRFADLERYVPRGRTLLAGYAATVAATSATALVPALAGFGLIVINPLLILGGFLFIVIAAIAAWRGSRYARFFLLGWTPLLAVTAIGSMQIYGSEWSWLWSDAASLACGALEALLFSLGLAERTLALRRAHDRARIEADIDPLTGLYNRRAWSERLATLERWAVDDGPLSLLFLDIDHFKRLNDQHGHPVGDAVLRQLALAIRAELGPGDIAGRYGGEEFVVTLPGRDAAAAARIAERIRTGLRDNPADGGVGATVSVGAATRQPGEDLADLLRRADHAMYAAKKSGRDRIALAHANPVRRVANG